MCVCNMLAHEPKKRVNDGLAEGKNRQMSNRHNEGVNGLIFRRIVANAPKNQQQQQQESTSVSAAARIRLIHEEKKNSILCAQITSTRVQRHGDLRVRKGKTVHSFLFTLHLHHLLCSILEFL